MRCSYSSKLCSVRMGHFSRYEPNILLFLFFRSNYHQSLSTVPLIIAGDGTYHPLTITFGDLAPGSITLANRPVSRPLFNHQIYIWRVRRELHQPISDLYSARKHIARYNYCQKRFNYNEQHFILHFAFTYF